MFDHDWIIMLLGVTVVLAPFLLLPILGFTSLIDRPLTEHGSDQVVRASMVIGLLASLCMLAIMLLNDRLYVPIEFGDWVAVPHYHYSLTFVFDRLSVPFVILTFVLCGTISSFASRYLHREPGYNRFFMLYSFFVAGMVITGLAGTIETLFAGWELVGLSSALLIGFFQERPAPVRNALWVWGIYRISDAALLVAAILLHQVPGQEDFHTLCGLANWPDGQSGATSERALLVGGLLLVAAAGKSALVPFSGWLPRAMEGPTPSSAVFYGALSVHLGAYLLLRISPVLEASTILSALVVFLGLATALYASITGRVQTDIKSALSFASLTQVGIIVAEIGIGFRYLALVHLLGHACFRTLQFVRAPSLLQDYRGLENAIGGQLPQPVLHWDRFFTPMYRTWLYRFALERGYLDSFLNEYAVVPFTRLLRWCDASERRWTNYLAGKPQESNE